MSRKKRNKKAVDKNFEETEDINDSRLHPETKKSVWAVVFFGLGYYLLPLILFVVAGVFLVSDRRKIYQITFFGAVLFILAGLGLIDIVFPDKGGLVGSIIGLLEIPFGYVASIVAVVISAVAAMLITVNLPIRIKKLSSFFWLKTKLPEPVEVEVKEMPGELSQLTAEEEKKIQN